MEQAINDSTLFCSASKADKLKVAGGPKRVGYVPIRLLQEGGGEGQSSSECPLLKIVFGMPKKNIAVTEGSNSLGENK